MAGENTLARQHRVLVDTMAVVRDRLAELEVAEQVCAVEAILPLPVDVGCNPCARARAWCLVCVGGLRARLAGDD